MTTSGDTTVQTLLDKETPVGEQIRDLYKLVDELMVCMFTTRRPDGHLVSRAMRVQQRTSGVDLWFVTNNQSFKVDEIKNDAHVNLSFYKDATGEWISLSGTAKMVEDKEKVKEMYTPDLKAWFADLNDGVHTGEADDPRMNLIFFETHSAHYQLQDRTRAGVLYQIAKGTLTGEVPKVGKIRELDEEEVKAARLME
ncbi:hypothetical protein HK102_007944, partial [Quaeritorhiza haematococci]